ncbi:MAG: DUF5652 family protein [Paludibacter sp.]|jgi:hypothetical protein|nr:DUF5652 family protein [Paludibacter sp.]
MNTISNSLGSYAWMLPFIIVLVLWDSVWKLIAMWKAGRNNELVWFICIAIFNTIGILPIIYIFLSKKKPEENRNN